MKRLFLLVLDSFGIGGATDAKAFGDQGANTLAHIATACAEGEADNEQRKGPLQLPNFARLGLFHAANQTEVVPPAEITTLITDDKLIGAYACASEISSGKDTTSGHWEIAGVPVLFDWHYFSDLQNSFPPSLLEQIIQKAQLPGFLGNCHASGTAIIEQFALEHMRTGKPIIYTSADSVFQIACHEQTFGLERLYELCKIVRTLLNEQAYRVSRVIARPFTGHQSGKFQRTVHRADFSVVPPAHTVLQKLIKEQAGQVVAIGKIADIYANSGISFKRAAYGLPALFDATLDEIKKAKHNAMVFTNFVDFDMTYGHRRDVAGYAAALEYFDSRLPELLALITKEDLLIITADHGCDPTWHGSDHTREQVPVLLYHPQIRPINLGSRQTYADIGQTVADFFALTPMSYGVSMLPLLNA